MGDRKTALTPEEMITAAFMHYVRDVDQQDIAIMLGGVNIGRVNEACRGVAMAVGLRASRPGRYPTVLPVVNNEA